MPRQATRGSEGSGLDARERSVLKEVIHAFILTGEPVSSLSLARRSAEGLSAATLRNTMAQLERRGYLAQPHASAGRVPTHAAYHLYVELLMQTRVVPARQRRYIADHLRDAPPDPEQLIGVTSRLLSELSQQIGLVVAPSLAETVLKEFDLLPLSQNKVLCVVVSASGFVDHRVVELQEALPRHELVRIANFLTDRYAGRTLSEIRESLMRGMVETKAEVDRLLSLAVAVAQRALADDTVPEIVVEGTSSVLDRPELTDVERVRRLLDTFADEARLIQLLNQLVSGPGLRVVIGEDSDLTSKLDFSLVATTYGTPERAMGTLGIFGPSRMEYERVIPLVHHVGQSLGRALARAASGEAGRVE